MTDASSDAVLSPSMTTQPPRADVGGECSAARPVVGGLPSPSGAENTHVQGAGLTAENHGASGETQVVNVFAEVECSVEGCDYTNRPSSTSWAYHAVNAHGATWEPVEGGIDGHGLVIPDEPTMALESGQGQASETAPCVLPCNNPAVPGSDLCAEHREEAAVDMCLDGDHGPLCAEFGLDCEEATDA